MAICQLPSIFDSWGLSCHETLRVGAMGNCLKKKNLEDPNRDDARPPTGLPSIHVALFLFF